MKTKSVDLSKWRDLDITYITIRETCARDTMDAASRSLPTDGREIQPQEFGLEMRIQAIAGAIVEYADRDGQRRECRGPCLEYRDWSNRTREFVGEIYDYLNGMSPKERDDFQKALAGGDASPPWRASSAVSSASGSSSPGT